METDPMAVPLNDEARSSGLAHLRVEEAERLRPGIADPGPLGLAGLAMTTLVFSMFNTGLLARSGAPVVLALALVYGGLAQLLAGMWEFRRGNSFGALTFTSFGAFWLSYWVLNQFIIGRIPAAEAGDATALFLIAWGALAASLWVASLRTTAAVCVTLLLLAVQLVLLGIGAAGAHPDLIKIGGGFGLATAVAAWYAAFAGVVNSTFGRTVLPLVPLRGRS